MWFPTNRPWVIMQQQTGRPQIYRSADTLCLNDIFTVSPCKSILTPLTECSHPCMPCGILKRPLSGVWTPLFGYKPKRCMTAAWGGYCGLRVVEVMLPAHSSVSDNIEVSLPWVPGVRCHSGCSGVAPLSLVVSVSGKSSRGSEGMQGWRRRWWSEWLLPLLGMAHVFHLLGNSYGSLCNHRSLLCARLLCCDGVLGGGGLQQDEAASTDLEHCLVENTTHKNQQK